MYSELCSILVVLSTALHGNSSVFIAIFKDGLFLVKSKIGFSWHSRSQYFSLIWGYVNATLLICASRWWELFLFFRRLLTLSLGRRNGVLVSELAGELFLFSHSSSSSFGQQLQTESKISLFYKANKAGTFREAHDLRFLFLPCKLCLSTSIMTHVLSTALGQWNNNATLVDVLFVQLLK